MNKTTKCTSREELAHVLQRDGVLRTEEVPTFLGGKHEQDDGITLNYSKMVEKVDDAMHEKAIPCSSENSNAFICGGEF